MVDKAARFAMKAHEGTFRKGTRVPYIVHPLETAVIVSMMTDDEEVICAALLHDVVEDAKVTGAQLRELFGRRVEELVLEETEDKSRPWKERKAATIKRLETASRESKILILGDKLSNIRCTARDSIALGERIWERFHEKRKSEHAWYYIGVADRLLELSCFPAYQEYSDLCRRVFGDWRQRGLKDGLEDGL